MRLSSPYFAFALALAACGPNGGDASPDLAPAGSTCALDSRGQTYQAGMSVQTTNKLFTVKLIDSVPGPPRKGDNDWFIAITDDKGAPVTGAAIKVAPFMPDHGHGTPILVTVKAMDAGQYQLSPLNLFMSGIWRVTLTITAGASSDGDAGGATDQALFYFCIEG